MPSAADLPSLERVDSRRLTGPHLVLPRAGAILDVAFAGEIPEAGRSLVADRLDLAEAAWRRRVAEILAAVGWGEETLGVRRWTGEDGAPVGLSLAFTAPIDALYAATEVNEWAWDAAAAELAGAPVEEGPAAAAERLRQLIAEERDPALRRLEAAAREHGVTFLWDDDRVSVGLGRGARTWEREDGIPAPQEVPWEEVHDIPVVLITGTNGKTTTVRMLAALVLAAGRVPGLSSTDGIRVGEDWVESGDYSGPEGARTVLRRGGVDVAVLEVARGGLLRRGVAAPRATVAVVTNVAADHLGEWGVHELEALADTKLLVAAVTDHLVANRDDPRVRRRAEAWREGPVPAAGGDGQGPKRLTWFGLETPEARSADSLWTVEGGDLVRRRGGEVEPCLPVERVGGALGGLARHNLANALAAAAAGEALGLPREAIAAGLARFESDPKTNPGRLNRFELGGVRIVVDFAHNPHGVEALAAMAQSMEAERRLILLGQAGDRTDQAIRGLARAAWQGRPDRVIIKGMKKYLRGRESGEITGLLEEELRRAGAPPEAIVHAESERQAVLEALAWARPGDLLLLISHEARDWTLELLGRLEAEGWEPGRGVEATLGPEER